MNKSLDVVAIGELLIDFTPNYKSSQIKPVFEANPGGAPANVLAGLSKLNKKTAFIGMVGKDHFGDYLINYISGYGINVSGLKQTSKANTTLAFVHLDKECNRSFSFYRKPGADIMLNKKDIDYSIIKKSKIFHFGSLSLTNEPSKAATIKAVQYAKKNGLIISYDPNYRPPLWNNIEDARLNIIKGLKYTDILKISGEELELITSTNDLEKGSNLLFNQGISIILITLGPDGAFYKYRGGSGKLNTYNVKVVDTTGAGDAFLAGFLYKIIGKSLEELSMINKKNFENIVDFANATGALVASKKGAIPAMPSLKEIEECRKKIRKKKSP